MKTVAGLFILWVLAAPSQLTANNDSKALQLLLHQLDSLRQDNDISALGLSIVEGDRILWQGGMGFHSHAEQIPMTAGSSIRVGSITKGFTGLALLHAEAQGLLSLDHPADKYIGGGFFDNPWRGTSPVTLGQLLEHTAGFSDISQAEWDYSTPGQPLLETLTEYAGDRKVLWRPGLHSSYSNAGAGLAAYALERVSNTRYENYLDQHILAPLGMKHSGFLLDHERNKLVTGYDTDGQTVIPYWHMVYRPFGGLNSTVEDMTRYLRMLISRGAVDGKPVFSPAMIARVEVPKTSLAARRGLSFGYGLGNYQWQYQGVLLHGHGGDADGYLSRLGYSSVYGRGYFLVINAFNGLVLRQMQKAVEQYLVGGFPGDPVQPAIKLGRASLQALSGEYEEVTRRFSRAGSRSPSGKKKLSIEVEGDALAVRFGAGRSYQLVPVAPHQFRWAAGNIATVSIARDEQGHRYFQSDDGNFRQLPAAP